MGNVIEVEELMKNYTGFQLGKLCLKIPDGCIVGLIGENGAGKTTLLKSLLGIIRADKGSVRIFGKDIKKNEREIKEEIGVVLDNMFFPESLRIKDVNTVMKDVYKKWDTGLFEEYISRFQLPRGKVIKELSKGMRKKLEIAVALSHHPRLLILDEPTSGLDPVARKGILDIFMDFMQDEAHSILFSTHITSDLERIADYIVLINKGNVEFDSPRDELLDHYGILKCGEEEFSRIEKGDAISCMKNRYDCEVLVKDRNAAAEKYKDFVVDKITLEDFMVLMIKGEKQ